MGNKNYSCSSMEGENMAISEVEAITKVAEAIKALSEAVTETRCKHDWSAPKKLRSLDNVTIVDAKTSYVQRCGFCGKVRRI